MSSISVRSRGCADGRNLPRTRARKRPSLALRGRSHRARRAQHSRESIVPGAVEREPPARAVGLAEQDGELIAQQCLSFGVSEDDMRGRVVLAPPKHTRSPARASRRAVWPRLLSSFERSGTLVRVAGDYTDASQVPAARPEPWPSHAEQRRQGVRRHPVINGIDLRPLGRIRRFRRAVRLRQSRHAAHDRGPRGDQAGQISIGGTVVNDLPPARRYAMVFQDYALYPHKTVFENMAFGLGCARSRARDQTERRRGGRHPQINHCYSASRVRSRAGNGSALQWRGRSCASEQAFLFDEPLSNLDALLRSRCLGGDQEAAPAMGNTISTSRTTR